MTSTSSGEPGAARGKAENSAFLRATTPAGRDLVFGTSFSKQAENHCCT